ncbi:LuxR C-terminal-related transcriptional regulator [Kitasatospora albolonga]|uniref:LuxR C-terminal-related transcriptional regulator n=1 Tax=Kitasatospora albolonga TaxID=68173 RepID=UPI0031EA3251
MAPCSASSASPAPPPAAARATAPASRPANARSPTSWSRAPPTRRIAQALFLSPRTVEQHVAHVLKKLDTTRKTISDVHPGDST